MRDALRQTVPYCLALLLLLSADVLTAAAQPTQQLTGRVVDADTERPLAGATVSLPDLDRGTLTNAEGRYTFDRVPVGRYVIEVRFVGYAPVQVPEVVLGAGQVAVQDVALREVATPLAPVVVRAPRGDASLVRLSVHPLTIEETLRAPATFDDPARLAASFAGVAPVNDQANGLSVRGHAPNHVSWRLEGVPIVNPNHTPNAGTFSDRATLTGGGVNILSAQLLGTSLFFTGAFPAGYGNALGAVMDMRLRPGGSDAPSFTAQAGLIGLELAAEGPFSPTTDASYLANYRYSTVGLLSRLGLDLGDEAITFQDLAVHVAVPGSRGQRWSVFALGGESENLFDAERDPVAWTERKDRYDIAFQSRMGAVGTSLVQPLGRRGAWTTTVALSAIESERTADRLTDTLEPIRTETDDLAERKLAALTGYVHKLSAGWRVEVGAGLTHQRYEQRAIAHGDTTARGAVGGWLAEPFVRLHASLAPRLTVEGGLHGLLTTLGRDAALEPRARLTWQVAPRTRLLGAYGQHSQLQPPQLYLATTPGAGDLGLTRAHHLSVGLETTLAAGPTLSVEAYRQWLVDVPVRADRPSAFSALNLAEQPVPFPLVHDGGGAHAGIEVSVHQVLTGDLWYRASATLYDARYRGSDGIWRPARFDGGYLTHATGGKEWQRTNRRGQAITFGLGVRTAWLGGFRATPVDLAGSEAAGTTVFLDEQAFSQQLDAFFRTDVRLYRTRQRDGWRSTLSLDIQNVTNHQNVAFRTYDPEQEAVVTQYQLGLIPLLSYRVVF